MGDDEALSFLFFSVCLVLFLVGLSVLSWLFWPVCVGRFKIKDWAPPKGWQLSGFSAGTVCPVTETLTRCPVGWPPVSACNMDALWWSHGMTKQAKVPFWEMLSFGVAGRPLDICFFLGSSSISRAALV